MKHKWFYKPRLYPRLYLAFCSSQHGCRPNGFRLVEELFLGCSSSVLGFTPYGTTSKIFGLEIETLLSDYERCRFKRSLLKCLLAARRRDETRRESRLKSVLLSIVSFFYESDQFPASLLVLSRDVIRLIPQMFERLLQLNCTKHSYSP